MRQLRLLALFAPALFLPAACEDSSGSTPTPITFEAGVGFEAGPPAEAGPLPDAGGTDAADVFVPPVPKGVTVTVIDNLLPKANVRVISHDALGAVIGDAKTDATGKLTIATAPSMVTVLTTGLGGPSPVSFFAVADGDKLVVQVPPVPVDQAPAAQYSVTFTPGLQGQSVQASVYTSGGCSGFTSDTTATAAIVSLYAGCLASPTAILADGSTLAGTRDGFAFMKGVVPPAATTTKPIVLPAWTAPGATTLKATHIPGGSISNTGSLYMIANGASFSAFSDLQSAVDSQTGQTFATATGFAEAYQSFVRTVDDVAGRVESSILRRETAPATATTTLPDVDFTNALPYITAVAVDTTSEARPLLTLTSDKPLTGTDAGVVVVSSLNAAQANLTWTFVVPASAAATFKYPALPTDADAAAFTHAGSTNVQSAAFFEATQIPSYTEAKLIPVAPRSSIALLDPSVPLPINGTVRITSWAQPLR